MDTRHGHVLAVVETVAGEARPASMELLTAGRELADRLGGSCVALVIGDGVDGVAGTVAGSGADRVLVADAPELASFTVERHAAVIEAAITDVAPNLVLLPGTTSGRDLAPYLAAKRRAPALVDVVSLDVSGDRIAARRPVYQGKMLTEASAALSELVFVVVRAGVYQPATQGGDTAVEPEPLPFDPQAESRVRHVDLEAAGGGPTNLESADVVVVGGRGLGEAERFQMLDELAGLLHGAVGATRAVTDLGWRPHYEQVGQTGKTISPRLYIGVGVSGAVQHTVGMRGSETIVAINRDPDAPIFKFADFGIVGDLLEIVPLLNQRLREIERG